MKNKILIIVTLFVFSLFLRLYHLNDMGRTWDEPEYVEQGYHMVELLKKGDFDNPYFYTTYDHPPLVKYLYGIAAHFDVEDIRDGKPVFRYDYTYSRLLSTIIASLAVVLVGIIGWHLFSRFVGITAAVILASLPVFLGLSQLVTTESWVMLFFTASVYSFILLLKNYGTQKLVITGLITGIALQVKQSNGLLLPLFFLMYLVWFLQNRKKKDTFFQKRLFAIFWVFSIAVVVFILVWPTIITYFAEVYKIHQSLWHVQFSPKIWQITLSPPEVFFGRLMLTPIFYYPVYFLITTPILVLLLFLFGLKKVKETKHWIMYILLLWLFLPFIMSLYSWRQHGVRYIIQIYAPLALISAIGFESFLSRFLEENRRKYLYGALLIPYLGSIILTIKPYYLDYFNTLVGGTKTVYEKKLFQLGWWGEGVKEAAYYIRDNAQKGASVGIAISPEIVMPKLSEQKVSSYKKDKTYDFVIVNHYNIIREGFDDSMIRKEYRPVHFVKADGAILVTVYKKK